MVSACLSLEKLNKLTESLPSCRCVMFSPTSHAPEREPWTKAAEELAVEHPQIQLGYVDAQNSEPLMQRFKLKAPQALLFRNRQVTCALTVCTPAKQRTGLRHPRRCRCTRSQAAGRELAWSQGW